MEFVEGDAQFKFWADYHSDIKRMIASIFPNRHLLVQSQQQNNVWSLFEVKK